MAVATQARIPLRETVIFMRLFATMISAGLPLVQSLNVLARQSQNRRLGKVIQEVRRELEAGRTLAEAMGRHSRVFSDLSVNMVAAGEAGGALDTVLVRIADFLEKQRTLARKVRSALVYPAMIVTVATAAVLVMMIFVIPTFQEMFASANLPLPLPTRLVMAMSESVQSYWWAALGVFVALGIAGVRAWQSPSGRLTADRLVLKAPVAGTLVRKVSVSRFSRTLATLISAGVPILKALDVTAKTAGNRVIHDAIMRSRASIAGGATIAGPLEESGVFPPIVVRMIDVGEQTGGLDEMLSKVADLYDDEVDSAVETLLSAMEPAMIVILGLVVGGMIVAMYLPIFSMMGAVG